MKSPGIAAVVEPYICTPCLLKSVLRTTTKRQSPSISRSLITTNVRTLKRRRPQTIAQAPNIRRATAVTLASSTAINAPSAVPTEYRPLHSALQALLETAEGHVDVSRVQLALKSLESESPVIRIALLGLGQDGIIAARKLARVLLSDVLSDKQEWEKELTDRKQDERSLLLRYGEYDNTTEVSSSLRTIAIPSSFLQQNRIELLVTATNPETENLPGDQASTLEQFALIPALPTPTSADGRVVFVRYPVHRAIIVGNGIPGAMDVGCLPRHSAKDSLILKTINLPLRRARSELLNESRPSVGVVDADLALHALDLFRASNVNGAQYSAEWNDSGVKTISNWITKGQEHAGAHLNSTLACFIDATLNNIVQSIDKAEADEEDATQSSCIPVHVRSEILEAIRSWSAGAHHDLQLNMGEALESKAWKRTAWFRLFWRIDDVSASIGDILRLQWLTQAGQTLAYLSGRVVESGLATSTELKDIAAVPVAIEEDMQLAQGVAEAQQDQSGTAAVLLQMPTLVSRLEQQTTAAHHLFDPPWPHTIFLNRQQMLNTIVPEMHRRAQTLLLSTISTISGTSALGVWTWAASSGSMLYEGGAIAALGLAWSLRRLQKLWERERSRFTTILLEDGRKVLADVETRLRNLAEHGGKRLSTEQLDSKALIDTAHLSVDNCRTALQEVR